MNAVVAGVLGALSVLGTCTGGDQPSAPSPTPPAITGPPIRVLMVTATYGFRHDSIATARDLMASLAASTRAHGESNRRISLN